MCILHNKHSPWITIGAEIKASCQFFVSFLVTGNRLIVRHRLSADQSAEIGQCLISAFVKKSENKFAKTKLEIKIN